MGSEFQVNSYTTGSQLGTAVAVEDSGNFVVVWIGYQDGSGAGLFGQRLERCGRSGGGRVSSEQLHDR